MIKLGVLGSTKGTDLQAVLDAVNNGLLDAKVSVVVSNQESAYILERAKNHGVPTFFIPHKGKAREEFDREMTTVLQNYGVELVLLIGFMRILSVEFCQEWRDRILNVHPSLLPKYAGGMDTNVHAEVIKNGDAETGCTIHFVTEEVDAGPILSQKKCTVTPEDTVESLKTKVQALEGEAFIEAIKLIQTDKYD
ncbi:MAG TPA: phosphoribosylglycinamide formyltransferase [Candidatus Marinimicrobia bacterium]|jgi:formyltetrahydrofolate-dependent phosphoribosylglycinamide formyltransferase|nr:phosphoribosylglycinamide formyltransferase [Candidatus Neomarinimicrobiota bacterium]HHZ99293.1 phosphoribosylglycinamide formyltransferase [Candidatus Neomarinimicrobiota bacterium]HIB04062.1 phosphoribosylglycinamide formyltransferase [Candidatus Neomarinimicrobiota bacterium]HIB71029.1 phosphoribosylglycinamide formyltransferase [Candidatus Neomarinimicrobiota bacterium]HIB95459.1 phosphoribosylglycinamide formyltransferase [Candidatus Neomarinimicrobiota bacterium]